MKCYDYTICFTMPAMNMVQNNVSYVAYSNYDIPYRLLQLTLPPSLKMGISCSKTIVTMEAMGIHPLPSHYSIC
jgi:hypothetical protein